MKTGVSDLPRSVNQGNEFLMLREKKHRVRIEGEGFVVREWRFSDCDSLAENANNEKIWNNVMDHFPHPYTKQDAFDYISMVHAMPAPPMRFAIEVDGKAVGSIGFGSEGDIELPKSVIGWENLTGEEESCLESWLPSRDMRLKRSATKNFTLWFLITIRDQCVYWRKQGISWRRCCTRRP